MTAMRHAISSKLNAIHDKLRSHYKRKHPFPIFRPGDSVWIRRPPTTGDKLDPLWYGPCEILLHIEAAKYRVALPHGPENVHVDDMKPYVPQSSGKSIPFHYYKPRDQLPDREENWQLEAILAHRTRRGHLEWQVKWKSDPQPTWEPASAFLGLIQEDWLRYNRDHNLSCDLMSAVAPHLKRN